MTERELLELAARAAGMDAFWDQPRGSTYGCIRVRSEGNKLGYVWNPLTDDGDALRLAVKLEMNVFQAAKSAYALPSDDDGTYEEQVRYIDAGDDPLVATRRAIVRAAAAIGGA